MRRLAAVLVLAVACGDDGTAARPDAAVDGAPPDVSYPACAEFSASAVAVPARVLGQLGNADVQSPATCDDVDAPFGIESAGPDRVVPIMGLTVGTPYIVRVSAAADLAFYVATGCETATGPSAAQCLLFQDASRGERELGRFVASAPTAYVVVDYWESQPPAAMEFTLDVYAEACTGDAQCSGATPACVEGQCVQCETSFDCPTAAAPVCGATQVCVDGADACTSDDASEPADDGPAGARPIVLDGSGSAALAGRVCSSPPAEADFFAFEVTSLGETWELALAWAGARDLDLGVYDASGTQLGLSFWEQPESIRLTYLPLGTYYVRVREFADGAGQAASLPYTLTARRTLGAACTAAADCAREYRNQLFRGRCDAGACVPIAGAGAIAEGGACDRQADCADGLACPSFYFTSDADTRDRCARMCTGDGDCAPLGAGFVCTTYLSENFCVPACSEDDHCPTAIQEAPARGPWARLRCDLPTGRCVP